VGVFEAVVAGAAQYGVVPLENSASGTLHAIYDLLMKHDVAICGELGVRETYCLCAKTKVDSSQIRRVMSHPNILEACSTFIEDRLPNESSLEILPTRSTSDAAAMVASLGGGDDVPISVAIATKAAAVRHGLVVIAENIGNDAFLESRYVAVQLRSKPASTISLPLFPGRASGCVSKTSACFALKNEPGAVFKLMSCWALRGLDVLRIETRPFRAGRHAPPGIPSGLARMWDYVFFVDWLAPCGHTEHANAKLWDSLAEFSVWQRNFGTYDSLVTRVEKQPQSWEDMAWETYGAAC
jgi:prephenate dehydratase